MSWRGPVEPLRRSDFSTQFSAHVHVDARRAGLCLYDGLRMYKELWSLSVLRSVCCARHGMQGCCVCRSVGGEVRCACDSGLEVAPAWPSYEKYWLSILWRHSLARKDLDTFTPKSMAGLMWGILST